MFSGVACKALSCKPYSVIIVTKTSNCHLGEFLWWHINRLTSLLFIFSIWENCWCGKGQNRPMKNSIRIMCATLNTWSPCNAFKSEDLFCPPPVWAVLEGSDKFFLNPLCELNPLDLFVSLKQAAMVWFDRTCWLYALRVCRYWKKKRNEETKESESVIKLSCI